jgi:hypothetical protein
VKNGVDWDVALGLHDHEAFALSIVFREQAGFGEWDWDAMAWKRPRED